MDFSSINSNKIITQKEILSRLLKLSDGEFFTVVSNVGVNLILKENGKAVIYPIFTKSNIIQTKLKIMNNNDFFFVLTNDTQLYKVIKQDNIIRNIAI